MDYPWSYMTQSQVSPYASYEQPPQQPYYHAPLSSSPYAYDSYTPFTSLYIFHETYPSLSYQPFVENQENIQSSYIPYHTGMSSGFKDINKETQADNLAQIHRELDELDQQVTLLTQNAMDREKEELWAQPPNDLSYEMFTIPYMSSHDQGLSFIALKTKHEIENINVPEVSDPRDDVLRVDHDNEEDIRRVIILPKVFDPRKITPIIDEVKGEMSLECEREGFEREESQCGDFVKEKDLGFTTPIMHEISYILHSSKTCMPVFYDIGFNMGTYTYLLFENSLLMVHGKGLYALKHPQCGVG